MTDLNKSHNKHTDIDTGIAAKPVLDNTADNVNHQQVSIKAWSQKLLVVILCIASFYGGWKSYESNMVSECRASGGQMVENQKTMLCQLS